MKLTKHEIAANAEQWIQKGYSLPKFDVEKITAETNDAPDWIHFGAGNIFRAFIASIQQDMLNVGAAKKGIVVAEGYDFEIVDAAYRPYDNLCLLVTMYGNGEMDKTILASVADSLRLDPQSGDYTRLKQIFALPGLKLASFTITEKGYQLRDPAGRILPGIEEDFSAGPGGVHSYLGKVTALLYERYRAGAFPIAMVSMDNCSHNGSRLYEAIHGFAKEWAARDLVDAGFAAYVESREKVGFPWTMIDKITPRPDQKVIEMLSSDGFEDARCIKTSKGTYVAPFVNAEETQYLVLEDWFPNGRPPIETARGVRFADRETVDKVERMKVCTCLNPLHTALAVFGCLLGYRKIAEEMQDPELKRLAWRIGNCEGLPVVIDPGILDPREFLDTVLNVRFPNKFMPDTPQRIATDTSQKLAIRFGETVKAYMAHPELDPGDLRLIPLVFAGWLRYAMGIDDEGRTFLPSDDPMLEQIQAALKDIRLGDVGPFDDRLHPIFANARIFGVDLYKAGLGKRAEGYFEELVAGRGAVRAALRKYLS